MKNRLAPLALLAFPAVETVRVGVNFRPAQFVSLERDRHRASRAFVARDRARDAHRIAARRVEREVFAVEVTFTALICTGIPSIRCGIAWGPAVGGDRQCGGARVHFDLGAHHDTVTGGLVAGLEVSCSRSNGPALTGFTIDRPNGAPSYFSVRYTLPPMTETGCEPTPAATVVSPIALSGPQVPSLACASGQSLTPESRPARPGGHVQRTGCMSCSPSSRAIVVVNALNAPALMFERATRQRRAERQRRPGHGPPFGPEVIWKVAVGVDGALPDHGVNDAWVV